MAALSKLNRRTLLLLCAAVTLLRNRRQKSVLKKKQQKRFWKRSIFQRRGFHSEYFTLFQELRGDPEFLYKYIRMSKSRFDHLLSLVKDKLKKEETNMRKPISPGERLLITLRYLCTGMSQQALCYSFRVGKQTVSNIIKETCDALYDVLQPVYMNAPSCIEDWKRISDEFELLWDMPHTIGAIDGKHIAIDCPHNTGSLYHNYKWFFSTCHIF